MGKSRRFLSLFHLKTLLPFVIVMLLVGFFYAYPISFTQKIVDELNGLARFSVILTYICSYMICRICGCIFDCLGGVLSKIIANDFSENLKGNFLTHYYQINGESIYNEKFGFSGLR